MSRAREIIRAAFVIGRRDVQATLFSRTFLLFLLAPVIPLLFGVSFAFLNERKAPDAPAVPSLQVIASGPDFAELAGARARLAAGDADLPVLAPLAAGDSVARSAAQTVRRANQVAVLVLGAHPQLFGTPESLRALRPAARLLVEEARRDRLLARAGAAPPPVSLALHPVRVPASEPDRADIARIGQAGLFMLTLLLAPMLLSNVVEEKSNKVIEVLAAAVPVPSIFLGKIFGMLTISLVGLAVWTAGACAAVLFFHLGGAIPPPAIGWPSFAVLAFLYFALNYLLQGALFLGLGSHAASVREVQILSMPVTMAQLALFGLASSVVGDPEGVLARAAAIFPWSSALSMIARAALRPGLWPHLLALGWQAGWVSVSIAVSAALFRRNVLKSGGRRRAEAPPAR